MKSPTGRLMIPRIVQRGTMVRLSGSVGIHTGWRRQCRSGAGLTSL